MKSLKLILFTAFLAILCGTSYSADKYPATIVVNGDTIVAITRGQRDAIFQQLNKCRELPVLDSLNRINDIQLMEYRSLSEKQLFLISQLKDQVSACKLVVDSQSEIYSSQQEIIKTYKKKERRVKFASFLSIIPAVGAGVLIGVLIH